MINQENCCIIEWFLVNKDLPDFELEVMVAIYRKGEHPELEMGRFLEMGKEGEETVYFRPNNSNMAFIPCTAWKGIGLRYWAYIPKMPNK